jgi:hypothetical protein
MAAVATTSKLQSTIELQDALGKRERIATLTCRQGEVSPGHTVGARTLALRWKVHIAP